MGSDAEIYVFDYSTYVKEVVPALRKLLLTGEADPWLGEVMSVRRRAGYEIFDLTLLRNADLLQYCTYLTPDLAYRGPTKSRRAPWEERACRSQSCAVREWCPFHTEMPNDVIEELQYVIENALVTRCLGKSQFLGRTVDALFYRDFLDELGVAPDHCIRTHLNALYTRGFVIGDAWSNCDGIHGWLDPNETHDLAWNLSQLPLPKYEPSFEELEAINEAGKEKSLRLTELMRQRSLGSLSAAAHAEMERLVKKAEAEWPALSLSFVRTVATIAIHEDKGVLWGNDVHLSGSIRS